MKENLNSIKRFLENHTNLTGTYKLAYINDQLCNIMHSSNVNLNGYTNNGEEVKDYITSGIDKKDWTPSMKKAVNKINNHNKIGLWTTWNDNGICVAPTNQTDLVEAINNYKN